VERLIKIIVNFFGIVGAIATLIAIYIQVSGGSLENISDQIRTWQTEAETRRIKADLETVNAELLLRERETQLAEINLEAERQRRLNEEARFIADAKRRQLEAEIAEQERVSEAHRREQEAARSEAARNSRMIRDAAADAASVGIEILWEKNR
jgi:hypothetical protein